MAMDAISLFQFAAVSTIVVGLKITVPRVYTAFRAKRRLAAHLMAISRAQGKKLRCDDRALGLLDRQLGVLLFGGRGLSGLDDLYLHNKEGDSSLEMIQVFARAFAELTERDKWIVERVLRHANRRGRTAYLRDAFIQAASCRSDAFELP